MFSSSGSFQVKIEVLAPRSGDGYFQPGEVVAGKVVYSTTKEQAELSDASIEFTGKLHTEVMRSGGNNSRRRETEVIYLFKFQKTLHQGQFHQRQFTEGAQRVEWPFEFRFPDAVNYARHDDGNNAFARAGSIPLPPTFDHTTGSFSKAGSCYIKYKLKAHVNRASMFSGKDVERPLPLRQVSTSPPPPAELGILKLPFQQWSSRQLRKESHTFSQKVAHVLTNKPELRTPSINFEATLRLPTTTTETQALDMILTAKQKRLGPTDPEWPPLYLGDVRIFLEALTELRVERKLFSGSTYDDGKESIRHWVFKKRPERIVPLNGAPITVAQGWRLADLKSTGALIPDFATWTVRYVNRIKIEIDILHIDENNRTDHVFKLEQKLHCRVLPEFNKDSVAQPQGMTVGPGLPELEVEQQPLELNAGLLSAEVEAKHPPTELEAEPPRAELEAGHLPAELEGGPLPHTASPSDYQEPK